MNTYQLLLYYINLLIFQYFGKPKASGTIYSTVPGYLMPQVSTQQISFSMTPTSGIFTLIYNGNTTSNLTFAATDSEIQAALRALPGLSQVVVDQYLVTFVGVNPPAYWLTATSGLMTATSSVQVIITETDLTLPLAVQAAFNLVQGTPLATGVQLDIIGKYVGVKRTGPTVDGVVTLSDADFYIMIQFATLFNSAGSSLFDISNLLFQYFGLMVLVFDNENMSMSFMINSSLGSPNLISLVISEGLLPVPMGVQYSVIYAPIIDAFFGFVTYQIPVATNNSPFNTYQDYNLNWPWLDYNDVFTLASVLTTETGNQLEQENGGLILLG